VLPVVMDKNSVMLCRTIRIIVSQHISKVR